ncbi:hypothetical protein [Ohtaekwangia koreensis]|uniref:Lipoprotein n=1 Tax=Ohtaekwangia koreensis TaxID=688867 RepID=A0A1T5INR8_9BACT|nr:hypothetical protein [Ohtaekwangia koreensis]SKC40769.1 hypothetical protein SAMN05660236_0222 [Ohtaekwangia koreensis]
MKIWELLAINSMNHIIFILFITLVGCSQQTNDKVPLFTPNSDNQKLNRDFKEIVLEKDFSVVFFTRADIDNNRYKIFALKGDQWEKIEINQNVIDMEEFQRDPDYCTVKDIVTKKRCRPEEADAFLSKLKNYGLFKLPEENIIRENCKDSGVIDAGKIYIHLVSGSRVRSLEYYDVFDSRNRCPDTDEWSNILKIEELFKNEWIPDSLMH